MSPAHEMPAREDSTTRNESDLPMKTFFFRHVPNAILAVEVSTLAAVILFMIAVTVTQSGHVIA